MKTKHLVLVGGGHAHVLLIRALGEKPIDGVNVTLISEKRLTPYSGMLPGFVAGHYTLGQTNIDLQQLCQSAGIEWIEAKVVDLDLQHQRATLENQTAVGFDKLSIDIGSTPDLSISGAREYALGVKPISGFQQRWQKLLDSTLSGDQLHSDWGVVGAGAGGVELVLAMAYRLRHHPHVKFHLIYRGATVLPDYPANVVRHVEQALRVNKVELHPDFAVKKVKQDGLLSIDGQHIKLQQSIWCTGATGADWLSTTALDLSDKNFIEVNQFLQSTSHSNLFAVGDIAEMVNDPRPKAGVYAIRQAPMLEQNLRLAFKQQALKPIKLQTQFLSLISLGEKIAIASRNGFALKGSWVWRWKNSIDQKFMNLFSSKKMNDLLSNAFDK